MEIGIFVAWSSRRAVDEVRAPVVRVVVPTGGDRAVRDAKRLHELHVEPGEMSNSGAGSTTIAFAPARAAVAGAEKAWPGSSMILQRASRAHGSRAARGRGALALAPSRSGATPQARDKEGRAPCRGASMNTFRFHTRDIDHLRHPLVSHNHRRRPC